MPYRQQISGHRVTINLIANYSGKLWSIASVYLFVPLYIRYLGLDAYGIIAFHSALLGILFIADAGLSTAFAREVAKHRLEQVELATLLRSLEVVYLAIILVVAGTVGISSGWIASNWLKPTAELPAPLLQTCIVLMGGIAAIQVAMSLYNGGLMGADRHATANGFQIGFSMARSGLVVLPLHFYPDLRVYFTWQLVTAVVFLAWMRHSVWRSLGARVHGRFSTHALRKIGGFAAGMLVIAVISALNTQMDKLVLSKLLGLQDLARYSVAGLLAQAPSVITLPIAVSLLPRLTRWVDGDQRELLIAAYHRFSYAIASIAGIAGLAVAMSPAQWIHWWTGNSALSSDIDLTVCILTAGHVLLALQYMPYHLALAHGHSRTSVAIGTTFLVITPLLLLFLIRQMGISGAAIPWLLMNAVVAVLLATLLTRRFLHGQLGRWWLTGACVPFLAIAIGGLATQWTWSALGIKVDALMGKTVVLVIICGLACTAGYQFLFRRARKVKVFMRQT